MYIHLDYFLRLHTPKFTLPETNSEFLQADSWKMEFPFGMVYFQGRALGFRTGTVIVIWHPRMPSWLEDYFHSFADSANFQGQTRWETSQGKIAQLFAWTKVMQSCFLFGGTWKLKFMAWCLLHSVVFLRDFMLTVLGVWSMLLRFFVHRW